MHSTADPATASALSPKKDGRIAVVIGGEENAVIFVLHTTMARHRRIRTIKKRNDWTPWPAAMKRCQQVCVRVCVKVSGNEIDHKWFYSQNISHPEFTGYTYYIWPAVWTFCGSRMRRPTTKRRSKKRVDCWSERACTCNVTGRTPHIFESVKLQFSGTRSSCVRCEHTYYMLPRFESE